MILRQARRGRKYRPQPGAFRLKPALPAAPYCHAILRRYKPTLARRTERSWVRNPHGAATVSGECTPSSDPFRVRHCATRHGKARALRDDPQVRRPGRWAVTFHRRDRTPKGVKMAFPASCLGCPRSFAPFLILFLALSPCRRGRQLTGRVLDPAGRPVPGATVLVDGPMGVRTTTTDAEGRFTFVGLADASYRVLVEVPGFAAPARTIRTGADTAPLDLHLRIAPYSEAVVVAAAPVPRPLSESPASTTWSTAEELKARQLENVADALRTTPGFAVGRNGGRGALTSVFPRGGESDYTLVLVDGIRVNNFGGGFDFSLLPLGDVDQVEIVRGPQSAVFGADAIGGVVHLTTRQGGRPTVSGQIEGGGQATLRAMARHARHGRRVVVRRQRRAQPERRLHGHRAGHRRDSVQRRLGAVAGARTPRVDQERDDGSARGLPVDRRRARQSRALTAATRSAPTPRSIACRAARTRSASSACTDACRGDRCSPAAFSSAGRSRSPIWTTGITAASATRSSKLAASPRARRPTSSSHRRRGLPPAWKASASARAARTSPASSSRKCRSSAARLAASPRCARIWARVPASAPACEPTPSAATRSRATPIPSARGRRLPTSR